MQIDRIEIENFRCFEHFTAKFHKELTVIVGNNGCGKSTLLDAVSIAIGTFLTGFDDVGGYGISKDDALNKCYDMGSVVELQPQFPVAIEASGSLCGQQITWKRELHSAEGRTTIVDAKEMISISSKLQSRNSQWRKTTSSVDFVLRYRTAVGTEARKAKYGACKIQPPDGLYGLSGGGVQ